MEGRGVPRDPVNGESWLRRAALAGDAEAAALVGDLYAKGGDLPPNYAEAADLVCPRRRGRARRRGPRAGDAVSSPAPGSRAIRTRRHAGSASRASAATRSPARTWPTWCCAAPASSEDRVRTREWFEDAASKGDLVAAFNFGVCLAEGVGVERDLTRAAEWLRRAADGVVNAQFWYGRMLVEGRGMEADPEAGRAWIERAANVGMVDAQVALAEMMVNGRGGARDHAGAQKLFEAAAAKDHAGAQFALGALLGGGYDVRPDRPRRRHGSPRPRRRTTPMPC